MSDELRGERRGVGRESSRRSDQNFIILSARHAKLFVESGIVYGDCMRGCAPRFHARAQFVSRISASRSAFARSAAAGSLGCGQAVQSADGCR